MDNQKTEIVIAGEKELQQAQPLLDRAKELAKGLKDDADFSAAGELISAAKKIRKGLYEMLDKFVKRSYKTYTDDRDDRDRYVKPFDEAILLLNKPLADYNKKKEDERKAEEKRLADEAKKKADDETLALAEGLHSAGQTQAAEEVLSRPVYVAPPVVPKSIPKVAGMSFQDYWHAEVVDLLTVVKAVAAGTVPLSALQANMTFLNSRATSDKKDFNIPGVKAVCESKPTNR